MFTPPKWEAYGMLELSPISPWYLWGSWGLSQAIENPSWLISAWLKMAHHAVKPWQPSQTVAHLLRSCDLGPSLFLDLCGFLILTHLLFPSSNSFTKYTISFLQHSSFKLQHFSVYFVWLYFVHSFLIKRCFPRSSIFWCLHRMISSVLTTYLLLKTA